MSHKYEKFIIQICGYLPKVDMSFLLISQDTILKFLRNWQIQFRKHTSAFCIDVLLNLEKKELEATFAVKGISTTKMTYRCSVFENS